MNRWLISLVLLVCSAAGVAQQPHPAWTVNLAKLDNYRAFDRVNVTQWTQQQGLRFITPDELAVYQLNRVNSPTTLAPKNNAGGGGSFFFQVAVLDIKDGDAIKKLRLPSSAGLSSVAPTHDGSFIVRTGNIFYLYSSHFDRLASRNLPLSTETPHEDWQITISPHGDEVALVHRQVFVDNSGKITNAKAEVQVLNADTLDVKATFETQNMARWSSAEHFLVSTNPRKAQLGEFGVLDFSGNWKRVNTSLQGTDLSGCSYDMKVLADEQLAIFGCNGLFVLSAEGKGLFSRMEPTGTRFSSIASGGEYLASESMHFEQATGSKDALPFINMNVGGMAFEQRLPEYVMRTWPLAIGVYDLKRLNDPQLKDKVEIMAIPLKHGAEGHSNIPYYDVSSKGDLAVIEGDELRFYNNPLRH